MHIIIPIIKWEQKKLSEQHINSWYVYYHTMYHFISHDLHAIAECSTENKYAHSGVKIDNVWRMPTDCQCNGICIFGFILRFVVFQLDIIGCAYYSINHAIGFCVSFLLHFDQKMCAVEWFFRGVECMRISSAAKSKKIFFWKVSWVIWMFIFTKNSYILFTFLQNNSTKPVA